MWHLDVYKRQEEGDTIKVKTLYGDEECKKSEVLLERCMVCKGKNQDVYKRQGYDNAAKTSKKAYKENISLKEACVQLGFLTAEKFDEVFHPEEMA